jgi:hypothetical protein
MEAAVSGDGRDMLQAMDDNTICATTAATATRRWYGTMRWPLGTMAGALQNGIDRGDRTAMKKNLALAEQFLDVMRRDVAATASERTEDRAELREDRRETRNDRR